MRHGKKINHLSRTASHRSAMLSNMASSLIMHKRINTTVAKAKALRKYVEPLITKSKNDTTHSRRTIFSYLQSKEATQELFKSVSPKVGERPGGYTRIIKLENRLGDNAEMCMMELVDFNEIYTGNDKKAPVKKARTTRRRSTGAKKKAAPKTEAVKEKTEDVEVSEAPETDTTLSVNEAETSSQAETNTGEEETK